MTQTLHISARIFKIKCFICTENCFIWHCFKSKHICMRALLHYQQTFPNWSKVKKTAMTVVNLLFGTDKISMYFKTSPPIILMGKARLSGVWDNFSFSQYTAIMFFISLSLSHYKQLELCLSSTVIFFTMTSWERDSNYWHNALLTIFLCKTGLHISRGSQV